MQQMMTFREMIEQSNGMLYYSISLLIGQNFSFQNDPKNLDLYYKTDLDLGIV